MSFVDTVLAYTLQNESPRKYYYWSALCAISAVVKNNVYLNRQGGALKLFPNIYVLLVGRSGLRKGPPVNLARALVKEIDNTKVITGRSSIQAIISILAKATTKANGGPPIIDATGFLVSSEFAAFMIEDPQALTILTDLYDAHYNPEWTNTTKGSGAEFLKNPCITMLGASNEVHLKDALPDNAIGGGFLARTFVIYADKKARSDAGVDDVILNLPYSALVSQLNSIARVKGAFTWSQEARDMYRTWYNDYDKTDHSDDSTGTMERLHDHVLKTSMLVCLSRKLDLRLELEDIIEAIHACQDFIPGSKRLALGQAGKSISAPGTSILLRELITNPDHKITRAQALSKHWQHFDSFELDRIADSLAAQKAIAIKSDRTKDGSIDIIYVLNPKVLERFETKKES